MPFLIYFVSLRDDPIGDVHLAVAAACEAAATLLAVGVVRWYGRLAQLLRVAGFAAIVVVSSATFSLAFVLWAVVLLAAPSLRNYRAGTPASV